MISELIAVILCIASFLPAPFAPLFSEMELKYEISQGNFESPYIVRHLNDITVNGVSIDEYTVSSPDLTEGSLYYNAAQTLMKEFHKLSVKDIAVSDSEEKAFIITEELSDTDSFTLRVKNGNVYITGSKTVGISRGIAAFSDEVLAKAEGSFDLILFIFFRLICGFAFLFDSFFDTEKPADSHFKETAHGNEGIQFGNTVVALPL